MGRGDEQIERAGLSRRDLIARTAIAGAAAWTAPALIDSLTSPAGALTPPPCPHGNSYVTLYSPQGPNGGAGPLVDRPGTNGLGSFNVGSCNITGPGCNPTSGYQYTTVAAIGLTVSGVNISHNTSTIAQTAVSLTLDDDSCCTITRVLAHVHRFGAPTNPDCPSTYCQVATAGGAYLQVTGGAYGTKSVTVRPNLGTSACTGPNNSIHWGSPNNDDDCPTSGGQANGQPYGFMMIELSCSNP